MFIHLRCCRGPTWEGRAFGSTGQMLLLSKSRQKGPGTMGRVSLSHLHIPGRLPGKATFYPGRATFSWSISFIFRRVAHLNGPPSLLPPIEISQPTHSVRSQKGGEGNRALTWLFLHLSGLQAGEGSAKVTWLVYGASGCWITKQLGSIFPYPLSPPKSGVFSSNRESECVNRSVAFDFLQPHGL